MMSVFPWPNNNRRGTITGMPGISFNSPAWNPIPPIRFRFRVVHLIYATALLAAALAVFGQSGALVTGLALCFWAPVFMSTSRPRTLLSASVIVFGVACPLCICLLPAMSTAERAARRMKCSNHLRQIALALDAYHTACGQFPPAYVADQEGRPVHSWRVLILPFLGEQQLYDRYDFDEPWNGPHNRKLLDAIPRAYQCPVHAERAGASGQCTSYVAVVGEGTLWPGAASGKLTDIRGAAKLGNVPGGPSNTVLLIEDSEARVLWTKPRDWTLDEAIAHLSSSDPQTHGPHWSEDFFYDYLGGGRHAACADGSVQFYSDTTWPSVWFEIMTIDGRDMPAELDAPRVVRPKKVKVANWLRLGALLTLLVLPVPWVWLNPTSSGAGKRRATAASPERPSTDGPSR
jgi:hypothetical protein